MTNLVNIGSTSGVVSFTFCFRFRSAVVLMRVISAEENEGFSFPETGQFNFFNENVTLQFPENVMFNPPKKEHFNLSKTASLISRRDKFQSPED